MAVKDILREYHARGFPKVALPVEKLIESIEKHGYSVDRVLCTLTL